MSLFGIGSGDEQNNTSFVTSTTQSNTGSGTSIAGGVTGGHIITNDPATALAALQANSFVTDRVIASNENISNFALSNTLDAIKNIVDNQTGLTAKTQELYYSKLADNAGVAPQTLAQQTQNNSATLVKIALVAGLIFGVIVFLNKTSK